PIGFTPQPREELTLNLGSKTQKFTILGAFGRREDTWLHLAVDEDTGKLFVIRKLATAEAARHCGEVSRVMEMIPEGYKGIYDAKWMEALPELNPGNKLWISSDEDDKFAYASAIVYPFIEGLDFEDYFSRFKGERLSSYSRLLLDKIIRVAEICADLETWGVPGIWDINSFNEIIGPDGDVVMIDYSKVGFTPTGALEDLFYAPFDNMRRPEREKNLSKLVFVEDQHLNDRIISGLRAIHHKIKSGEYTSLKEFLSDLRNMRSLFPNDGVRSGINRQGDASYAGVGQIHAASSCEAKDMYDSEEFKVLWFDMLRKAFHEKSVYKIKYDETRFSGSQIAIIKEYVRLLNMKTGGKFETAGFSSANGAREALLTVYKLNHTGNVMGKGCVDIDIPAGDDIKQYALRITGMLNIALAASNIGEDLSDGDNTPIAGFIRRECREILGDGSAIPDDLASLIKLIRNLPIPKAAIIPTEKIEEYNKLAKEALSAA
ncbi:MAG: hypothetical protein HQL28_03900, partial [Candidatus Omnitrophica bacterium]|nr:hypothetical protein [Candidatus Omnitrophota bacterium]